VLIGPDTTSQDLIRDLGLPDYYALSPGPDDTIFDVKEVLDSLVDDGDLLFAASRIDVC
jgi:hypothetical protein